MGLARKAPVCSAPECVLTITVREPDGGVQEHQLHRVGRGRAGQNPAALAVRRAPAVHCTSNEGTASVRKGNGSGGACHKRGPHIALVSREQYYTRNLGPLQVLAR